MMVIEAAPGLVPHSAVAGQHLPARHQPAEQVEIATTASTPT
jgi:hypothetical protein